MEIGSWKETCQVRWKTTQSGLRREFCNAAQLIHLWKIDYPRALQLECLAATCDTAPCFQCPGGIDRRYDHVYSETRGNWRALHGRVRRFFRPLFALGHEGNPRLCSSTRLRIPCFPSHPLETPYWRSRGRAQGRHTTCSCSAIARGQHAHTTRSCPDKSSTEGRGAIPEPGRGNQKSRRAESYSCRADAE
eukprot:2649795-Rhodomonas_salina.3